MFFTPRFLLLISLFLAQASFANYECGLQIAQRAYRSPQAVFEETAVPEEALDEAIELTAEGNEDDISPWGMTLYGFLFSENSDCKKDDAEKNFWRKWLQANENRLPKALKSLLRKRLNQACRAKLTSGIPLTVPPIEYFIALWKEQGEKLEESAAVNGWDFRNWIAEQYRQWLARTGKKDTARSRALFDKIVRWWLKQRSLNYDQQYAKWLKENAVTDSDANREAFRLHLLGIRKKLDGSLSDDAEINPETFAEMSREERDFRLEQGAAVGSLFFRRQKEKWYQQWLVGQQKMDGDEERAEFEAIVAGHLRERGLDPETQYFKWLQREKVEDSDEMRAEFEAEAIELRQALDYDFVTERNLLPR